MPAGADPLHDLLSDVTALAEVQRMHLLRLLRQSVLEDVLSVAGFGMLQPHDARLLGQRGRETCHGQLTDQSSFLLFRREDPKPGLARDVDPRHNSPVPVQVRPGIFRNRSAQFEHHFGGDWTLDVDDRQGVAGVLERDVIGDDEFIQVLVNPLANFRLHIEQDAVGQDEKIDIGENTPLRIQKERVAALAGLQLLDMVGRHGVQQPYAILA